MPRASPPPRAGQTAPDAPGSAPPAAAAHPPERVELLERRCPRRRRRRSAATRPASVCIAVSLCTRSAKARSSEPPPASTMPWRTMSPASSGGVCSSVAWTAVMISASGAAIAPRISWLVSSISRGRPETRSRPRMSTTSSSRSGAADPTASLIASALCEPIARHVLGADVGGDRLVEVVAAGAHRARDDDLAERDDRDLARAAADVDDHAPDRLGDRDARRRSRRRSAPRSGGPGARPPSAPPPRRRGARPR